MARSTEMNKPVFFAKSWFRAKKKPTEIWTEEHARAAHISKALYCAVVGRPERPFCFLEINNKFIGIGFLDHCIREHIYYAFREVAQDILFLTDASYREFEGGSDIVTVSNRYLFNPNGTVRVQRPQLKQDKIETFETSFDPSRNYERWPDFGEYEDFMRIDRE